MAKQKKIDIPNATAQELADSVLTGFISEHTLRAFIQRNGGAIVAHSHYPQIQEAFNIISMEKKKQKNRIFIEEILQPYRKLLAEGVFVLDIIDPVLDHIHKMYEFGGVNLSPEETLIMLALMASIENPPALLGYDDAAMHAACDRLEADE